MGELARKAVGIGDLDRIAGGVVDGASAWNPHGHCLPGRALPDGKRGAGDGGPLRSHSIVRRNPRAIPVSGPKWNASDKAEQQCDSKT